MLDTASWERKTLRVQDELNLDPKNVRLETASAQVEADIIEDLFDNEGVLGLVGAISKIGYLTHEIPIVVRRRGKYVVVEGNRRLAALKAIQNPMIVPAYQARVASAVKAMEQQRDRLASIEVLIAPNQALADQLIAALHTSNPRKPWSPARQAAFFQAQIDAGRTYKQLLQRYPTIDVAAFVLRARLVNRFKEAVLSEPDLLDFIGSKEWRRGYSSLTRVFESKDFRAVTGIELDERGQLTTTLSDAQLGSVATVVVRGMQDKSVNTRTLNTVKSPRFLQLMSDIRSAADVTDPLSPDEPAAKSSNDGEGATLESKKPEQGATKSTSKPPVKLASKKVQQRYLPTGHLPVPAAYPVAVGLLFQELTLIDVQRMPNATFLMLRAILEKSIKSYADEKGVDIGKTKHNNNGVVQLRNCLSWLVDNFNANGPRSLVQPALRVRDGKLATYTSSTDALNAINHNHKFHVDADEVINMWNSIDPLMRELMKS